jgi:hypothetical protein
MENFKTMLQLEAPSPKHESGFYANQRFVSDEAQKPFNAILPQECCEDFSYQCWMWGARGLLFIFALGVILGVLGGFLMGCIPRGESRFTMINDPLFYDNDNSLES